MQHDTEITAAVPQTADDALMRALLRALVRRAGGRVSVPFAELKADGGGELRLTGALDERGLVMTLRNIGSAQRQRVRA